MVNRPPGRKPYLYSLSSSPSTQLGSPARSPDRAESCDRPARRPARSAVPNPAWVPAEASRTTRQDGRWARKLRTYVIGSGSMAWVERVVVLGRGGAGKSTFARELGVRYGLPLVELDEQFWQAGLVPLSRERWTVLQRELVSPRAWILDGDLGPYDVLDTRLGAADTVIVLDYSLVRCGWRSIRRSRERLDFWVWVLRYRRRSLPAVLSAIERCAPAAEVHVFRSPRSAARFLRLSAQLVGGQCL